MTLSAVVFDLDGTLVDSLADNITHLNGSLADHGLPMHTPDDIGTWVGYGAEQLVRRAVHDAAHVPAVLATFRARYKAAPVIETHLYAGLSAVLDELAPRTKLAVLSNKPHELTVNVVAQVLARWPFAVVQGQRDGHPRKPDPGALVAVCRELGVAPASCAMVGDSEVDIATARAAGVLAVGVTWGLRDVAVLREAQPDVLVSSPDELAHVLRSR
jgi:phosphoglycolate phosphatase